MEKLYSSKEAAKYLGIGLDQLRRLVREKKIAYLRYGERVLKFREKSLDEYILRMEQSAVEQAIE